MGMIESVLGTVRAVESWNAFGRFAALVLIISAGVTLVVAARRALGRRAAQIAAITVATAAAVGMVLWAIVRVIDAA